MVNKDIDEKLRYLYKRCDVLNNQIENLIGEDEFVAEIKQLFLSQWEAQKPEKNVPIENDYETGVNDGIDQCDEIVRSILG